MIQNIATVMGLVAVALFVLSYQCKSRRNIIALNATSRVLYVAQYLLLGAFEGAVLDTLAFFISLLCGGRQKGFLKNHAVLAMILSGVAVMAAGALTYQNIFSLLAIAGVLLELMALWLTKESSIRIVSLFAAPCWLSYNLINLALGSAVGNVITMISLGIALVRYDVLKKENKQTKAQSTRGE